MAEERKPEKPYIDPNPHGPADNIATTHVRLKDGGQEMTINKGDFDPALHEKIEALTDPDEQGEGEEKPKAAAKPAAKTEKAKPAAGGRVKTKAKDDDDDDDDDEDDDD